MRGEERRTQSEEEETGTLCDRRKAVALICLSKKERGKPEKQKGVLATPLSQATWSAAQAGCRLGRVCHTCWSVISYSLSASHFSTFSDQFAGSTPLLLLTLL